MSLQNKLSISCVCRKFHTATISIWFYWHGAKNGNQPSKKNVTWQITGTALLLWDTQWIQKFNLIHFKNSLCQIFCKTNKSQTLSEIFAFKIMIFIKIRTLPKVTVITENDFKIFKNGYMSAKNKESNIKGRFLMTFKFLNLTLNHTWFLIGTLMIRQTSL